MSVKLSQSALGIQHIVNKQLPHDRISRDPFLLTYKHNDNLYF